MLNKPLEIGVPETSKIAVHIFESSREDDKIRERCEGCALSEIFNLMEINAKFYDILDVDSLIASWKNMLKDMPNHEYNVIHWSSHGNMGEVVLTDGTPIDWDEWRGLLTTIPCGQREKLLISFSSCSGLGAGCIGECENTPLYGHIIGPNRSVTWGESVVAYAALYYNLMEGKLSVSDAVKKMNIAIGSTFDNPFHYCSGSWQSACHNFKNSMRNIRIRNFIDYFKKEKEKYDER